MTLERGQRHSGPSSIMIVSLGQVYPRTEVLSLKECVSRLEYKLDNSPVRWEDGFGGIGDMGGEIEWDFMPSDLDEASEVELLAG